MKKEELRGLTAQEVRERRDAGLGNGSAEAEGRSCARIVGRNLLTFFNFLNFALAALVLLVGSFRNALFMGVVFCNLFIGIVQEIRAKKTIDRLTLISAPKAKVLREGEWREVPLEELVQDDVVCLMAGDQIGADGSVLVGGAEVNEALLTGEADAVFKKEGDMVWSGSFVMAGECCVRLKAVGEERYAAKLAREAKKEKKSRSELMEALQKLIRGVSILILPLGAVLFCKQYFWLGGSLRDSVVSTVAALIGLIPEGLVLLTSVALAVGVIRLGRYRALVQELYGIETLARVDVLCVDKTGTITQGDVELREVVALGEEEPYEILRELVGVLADNNATAQAVRQKVPGEGQWKCLETIPFSSERKWSGAVFEGRGLYRMGAPEFLFAEGQEELRKRVADLAAGGVRVLLLTHQRENAAEGQTEPVALLLFEDKLRETAAETFRFFHKEGVAVKVISGDHPAVAAEVAYRAGIPFAEKYVDVSTLSNEEVEKCAEEYTVFGRVTPVQKRMLVQGLQKAGHTVAMTGDGINDVLALREADCSIAMASGSSAARYVSKVVLLDSDFAALPQVVREGRRVINNIQRSASLFLVKTGYSFLLSVLLLLLPWAYPFEPIQLTLISSVAVGIPSFLLALEPNRERVAGSFLRKVLEKALPGALTVGICLVGMLWAGNAMGLPPNEMRTMSTLLAGFVSLLVLGQVCRPLKSWRGVLCGVETVLFYAGAILGREVFLLAGWSWQWGRILLLGMAGAAVLFFLLQRMAEHFTGEKKRRKSGGKREK